jgi:hypothetical protein
MRTEPSHGPESSERGRDGLLLELGALVFELHRRGRRAPELLQAKATALDELVTREPPAGAEALPCPHCFSAAEPGQLVCLECGASLGLRPPARRPRRTGLVVLAAVIGLAGAVGFGFALSELTSDDAGGTADAAPAAAVAAARDAPAGGVAGSAEAGDGPVALAPWPEGERGYAVILVTSSDEAGARKVAWDAARSGLEAGLLRSDEHAELGEGLWLVFAGRYDDAPAAERAAERLGARYSGAYVQQVVPAS